MFLLFCSPQHQQCCVKYVPWHVWVLKTSLLRPTHWWNKKRIITFSSSFAYIMMQTFISTSLDFCLYRLSFQSILSSHSLLYSCQSWVQLILATDIIMAGKQLSFVYTTKMKVQELLFRLSWVARIHRWEHLSLF